MIRYLKNLAGFPGKNVEIGFNFFHQSQHFIYTKQNWWKKDFFIFFVKFVHLSLSKNEEEEKLFQHVYSMFQLSVFFKSSNRLFE